MKTREANFELLRILAMLMIITLHFLDKGGILPKPDAVFGPAGYLAWGLEAFCVCAVNVYVLIGAYFLAEGDYRLGRAPKLWLQVFFYAAGIKALALAAGLVPGMDKYELLQVIFPVIQEHYWFVTAYLLMILIAPLMNDTLRRLPEKTYRRGILLLLVFLSLSSSMLPVKLPIDRMGYDTVWFLCLYLIGAYIRFHGGKAKRISGMLAGYAAAGLLIFASLLAVHAYYEKTGSLGDFINRQYQYNSVLCLTASVCLFLAFRSIRIPQGRASAVICRIASASFGVYLIHEHVDLRYRWPALLGTQRYADSPVFLLYWLPGVAIVYAVCMIIDFARQYMFRGIVKWLINANKR